MRRILRNFWLIGLSHWDSPVEVRERFKLSDKQILKFIEAAKKKEVKSVVPITTCNRTEIYAQTDNPDLIVELLLDISGHHSHAPLSHYIYTKHADEALKHLFRVTAGLDSQITGDMQIPNQITGFLQIALAQNASDSILTRMFETATGIGKQARATLPVNSTSFSVADEAVKSALSRANTHGKFLVVGAGSMGKLVIKRLLKTIPGRNITVINRSYNTSAELSAELGIHASVFESLAGEISKSNVTFVTTSASQPIVTKDLLKGINLDEKVFIDLSIPRNIEPDLPAQVIDISQFADNDKQAKQEYILNAEALIREGMTGYYEWLDRFELAQSIKADIRDNIFQNNLDDPAFFANSKFVDGLIGNYLRHFQKGKQSRNLAA